MEPVSLLILAGGRSSRMGRDKAWLEWEGRPLVEHVVAQLSPLADEVLISTNDPASYEGRLERSERPARLVTDVYTGAGPLAGLHAGLLAARNDLVLAAATDMPHVSAAVAQHMLEASADVDAVLPRLASPEFDAAQPEPLFAVYRKRCLPAIEAALGAGRRRVISFLGDVRVRYLDEDALKRIDPDLRAFRNLNTPEEWRAANDAADRV